MASNVQWELETLDNALYNHGLIKIITEAHSRTRGDNWKRFLLCNHFIEVQEEEMVTKPRISQHRIALNPNSKSINEAKGLIVDEVEKMENLPEILEDDTRLCQFLENIRQKNEK